MVDVFIYVPKEKADDIADCGMKLSEYSQRVIPVESEDYDCICGYLHPMDFEGRTDDTVACIRAEVQERYCYVCDGDLYELSRRDYDFAEKYEKSIVPLTEYALGDYRRPQCLVTCTIVGGSVYDADDDGSSTPLLYNDSEELYCDRLESYLVDKCGISREVILSSMFYRLRNEGAIRSVTTWDNVVLYHSDELNRTFSFSDGDCGRIMELLAEAEKEN